MVTGGGLASISTLCFRSYLRTLDSQKNLHASQLFSWLRTHDLFIALYAFTYPTYPTYPTCPMYPLTDTPHTERHS